MSPELAAQAAQAAAIMKAMAHEGRLLVLCYLAQAGEMPVGQLADRIGLSQSALSQHLALLRAEGLVATRKEAQSVHYRLADQKIQALLGALHDIYCPALVVPEPTETHCDR